MLHKNPQLISEETFLLIQQLQSLPFLNGFHLIGGTALTLQLGHRNSIDIDLFTQNNFDTVYLAEKLSEKFKIVKDTEFKNTLLSRINNIKVDFIKHNYPYVHTPVTEEGITFLSREDISAMKLNAISQSGKRLKDFIDIYFLLNYFSLSSMIDYFQIKYPQTNPLIPLKAINYFEDIDESIDPPKLLKPLNPDEIKKRIQDATLNPNKIY
ncbi:MAG: nucleotidyl transferase AbiEii/AbiGii toxin family protein [Bacteroidota bacterium]